MPGFMIAPFTPPPRPPTPTDRERLRDVAREFALEQHAVAGSIAQVALGALVEGYADVYVRRLREALERVVRASRAWALASECERLKYDDATELAAKFDAVADLGTPIDGVEKALACEAARVLEVLMVAYEMSPEGLPVTPELLVQAGRVEAPQRARIEAERRRRLQLGVWPPPARRSSPDDIDGAFQQAIDGQPPTQRTRAVVAEGEHVRRGDMVVGIGNRVLGHTKAQTPAGAVVGVDMASGRDETVLVVKPVRGGR